MSRAVAHRAQQLAQHATTTGRPREPHRRPRSPGGVTCTTGQARDVSGGWAPATRFPQPYARSRSQPGVVAVPAMRVSPRGARAMGSVPGVRWPSNADGAVSPSQWSGSGPRRRRYLWPLRPPSGRFRRPVPGCLRGCIAPPHRSRRAFDTTLAEVAPFAATLPRPARRTLRLSGQARKAHSLSDGEDEPGWSRLAGVRA